MAYDITLVGVDGNWKINIETRVIAGDYTATEDDYFIAAQIHEARTLTLPAYPDDGTMLVIKLDVDRWAEDKTLTITTIDKSTIDGNTTLVLRRPRETVQLISVFGEWNIISKYG
jgi:hypothetical protein